MIRVGFVLSDHSWIGGLNYLRNLFSSLALLEENKLQLILFVGLRVKDDVLRPFKDVEIIRSGLLDSRTPAGFARRVINKISGRRDPLLRILLRRGKIDILSHYGAQWAGGRVKKIGWIPDFQHLHLPEFFSVAECADRDIYFRNLICKCDCVLLSSYAAQRDLAEFFPAAIDKSAVLSFVPDIDADMILISLQDLERKYNFKGPYFYIPNQFWAHKNHAVVVRALAMLKAKGVVANVLLSGSTSDYRNPAYYSKLMRDVRDFDVESCFNVLGVIPYNDLLSLMFHSVAVINPSLFEGWSSTVEEAKALGKSVILSNIPVHVEQNPHKGIFFDPKNPYELAERMEFVLNEVEGNLLGDAAKISLEKCYDIDRLKFAQKYQEIVEKVMDK